jgi:hypothetical protein
VNTFSKPVTECINSFTLNRDQQFADLDRVTNDCLSIVYAQLPLVTSTADYRVPPLALIRFARGEKTLTVANIFYKLNAAGRVNPILISFNGNGKLAYEPQTGETQTRAMLRLIAVQLGDYTPEEALNLDVDRDALDSFRR